MTGWQWFWTLVGFLAYIIVLIFLFFYEPFRVLFDLVINGISFDNIMFWVAVISAIAGFGFYHWQAYQQHIVRQPSIEFMVSSSLQGSAFIAILLSAGTTLQAVIVFCVHLLRNGYNLDREFGVRLGAIVALVTLTTIFCIIFWLLRIIRVRQHT